MFGIEKATPVRDGFGVVMALLTALLLWAAVAGVAEATAGSEMRVEPGPVSSVMVEAPELPAPASAAPEFGAGRI